MLLAASVILAAKAAPAPTQTVVPNYYSDAPKGKASGEKPAGLFATPKTAATEPGRSRAGSTPVPTKPVATKTGTGPKTAKPKGAAPRAKEMEVRRATDPGAGKQRLARDFYQLAAAFSRRWDLVNFVITAAELTPYRMESAKARAAWLARILDGVTESSERSRRNLRNCGVAMYVMGRTVQGPMYIPANHTQPHLAALKSTARNEAVRLGNIELCHEQIRMALNTAAEEWRGAEAAIKAGRDIPDPDSVGQSVTVATNDLVAARNEVALDGRRISAETLVAILAAEQLEREEKEREPLSSFAPPLPVPEPRYNPFVPEDTPLPVELPGPGRKSPPEPRLAPPRDKGVRVKTPPGAPVKAAGAGKAGFAGEMRGFGKLVILEHADGIFTVYANLGKLAVAEGDAVGAGETLGNAGILDDGATPGVYFQVRENEEVVEPKRFLGNRSPGEAILGK
jgi:murein DD-endopeptidase MepM/ murein hydrolase activator NlpD